MQHKDSFEVAFGLSGLDDILQCGVAHFLVPKKIDGIEIRKENPFALKAEVLLKMDRKD